MIFEDPMAARAASEIAQLRRSAQGAANIFISLTLLAPLVAILFTQA